VPVLPVSLSELIQSFRCAPFLLPAVLGIEPHSILPIGMVAMSEHTGTIPLPKLRCGATDSIFYVPILRHVWSWLGLVPASKKSLKALLRAGTTVGVVPGGVQECLYMAKGVEVGATASWQHHCASSSSCCCAPCASWAARRCRNEKPQGVGLSALADNLRQATAWIRSPGS